MLSSLLATKTKKVTSDFATSNYDIKLILLGDTATGKTSIALRFSHNEFRPYQESTIGASFFEKTVLCEDQGSGKKGRVMFKIWDTAGQERYHALASMYYRGAGVAVLVYDISRPSSFQVLQSWAKELKEKGPSDIFMVVCGNKLDLDSTGDRKVSSEEAKCYADEIGAHYIETSARDNTNIGEMFDLIARRITRNGTESSEVTGGNTPIALGATAMPDTKSSCC